MIGFKINERQTLKNTRELLKKYRRLTLISKSAYELKSVHLSFEPKSETNRRDDQIDRFISRKEESIKIIKRIDTALAILDDDDQKLIKEKYLKAYRKDFLIYTALNISESTFYGQLNKALIHFAEAFGGDLVEWEE